ncbi:MAG: DegT/DnrJ/EryC1/StrS aminotransferase family protein [Treponema sp.]|jgi:dTDP-4-amino-4,6-dideoxygalactose transaminase|nr:DegT/DnrJ/EryC1/StrS aminotransferase family protein [Treponema sp.]
MTREHDIPFHRPFMGKEEEDAVLRVLRSRWLTTGAEAAAFETEFADFVKGSCPARLYALAVNSATSGLHLALEALGVGPGDLVFLPSLTFTSTAEVIRHVGADPVFVDIGAETFTIDPELLEDAIRAALRRGNAVPRAVIAVHYGGEFCDMPAISAVARRYGLSVVEDAAHLFPYTLGAELQSDALVFSFYATKTITSGEGGMLLSAREDLARRVSLMRNHGIDRSVWNRYTDTGASWYYQVAAPGFKYNLPDLLAAVGRVQLKRAGEFLRMRRAIAASYTSALAVDTLVPPPASYLKGALHLYPLSLRDSGAAGPRGGSRRNELIEKLKKSGIGTSVHFIPLHIMPYYRDSYDLEAGSLPRTMARFNALVSLPLWPGMSDAQIARVIEAVSSAAAELTG